MPERGGINYVRIVRVNNDSTGVVRFRETHMIPRFTAVYRFIHAVTPIRQSGIGITVIRFTGACPDNIRIGRGDRNKTKRNDIFIVENRLK